VLQPLLKIAKAGARGGMRHAGLVSVLWLAVHVARDQRAVRAMLDAGWHAHVPAAVRNLLRSSNRASSMFDDNVELCNLHVRLLAGASIHSLLRPP
jgi:hypothetical protein